MIYKCKKTMYDSIAILVTTKDLKDSNLTLNGFMCRYFEQWCCLERGSIMQIELH